MCQYISPEGIACSVQADPFNQFDDEWCLIHAPLGLKRKWDDTLLQRLKQAVGRVLSKPGLSDLTGLLLVTNPAFNWYYSPNRNSPPKEICLRHANIADDAIFYDNVSSIDLSHSTLHGSLKIEKPGNSQSCELSLDLEGAMVQSDVHIDRNVKLTSLKADGCEIGGCLSAAEGCRIGSIHGNKASLGGLLLPRNSQISGSIDFSYSKFHGDVAYDATANIPTISFEHAEFFGKCILSTKASQSNLNLDACTFHKGAEFKACARTSFSMCNVVSAGCLAFIEAMYTSIKLHTKSREEQTVEDPLSPPDLLFRQSIVSDLDLKGVFGFILAEETSISTLKFQAICEGGASFGTTAFLISAWFSESTFRDLVTFESSRYKSESGPGPTEVLDAPRLATLTFSQCNFEGELSFNHRTFSGETRFTEVNFSKAPQFYSCDFHPSTSFDASTKFPKPEQSAIKRYQSLKLAFKEMGSSREEGLFHALEQRCLRQKGNIRWSDRAVSWAYDFFSVYGTSIAKPFWWLFGVTVLFFLAQAYCLSPGPLFQGDLDWGVIDHAGQNVTKNLVKPLTANEKSDSSCPIYWMGLFQTILSIPLIAMLILSIRWTFRRS